VNRTRRLRGGFILVGQQFECCADAGGIFQIRTAVRI
jgi:hypothetical protein